MICVAFLGLMSPLKNNVQAPKFGSNNHSVTVSYRKLEMTGTTFHCHQSFLLKKTML